MAPIRQSAAVHDDTQSARHNLGRLVTEVEAAAMLCLSPTTLKKWRRTRRGPVYYRLGSAVRYKVDDLESYLEDSIENPRNPRHDATGNQ
jgi:hypothetical protein